MAIIVVAAALPALSARAESNTWSDATGDSSYYDWLTDIRTPTDDPGTDLATLTVDNTPDALVLTLRVAAYRLGALLDSWNWDVSTASASPVTPPLPGAPWNGVFSVVARDDASSGAPLVLRGLAIVPCGGAVAQRVPDGMQVKVPRACLDSPNQVWVRGSTFWSSNYPCCNDNLSDFAPDLGVAFFGPFAAPPVILPSVSASPSAATPVSPQPTATATDPPIASPTAVPTATPLASPTALTPTGPEAPPQVHPDRTVINPGEQVNVTYTGVAGTTLYLFALTQPSTEYRPIGMGTLDAAGHSVTHHVITRNTRIMAISARGSGSLQPLIQVHSVASLNEFRVGTRSYRFSGRVYPARDQRLVNLYRDGVLFGQGRTNAQGIYSVTRGLGIGAHIVQAVTRDDGYNLGTTSRAIAVVSR